MLKCSRHVSSSLLGVGCAIGLAVAGAPAFGQGSGGFTVMGHNRTPDAQDLSAAVSYRDLDLTTRGGRAALRGRVWRTAVMLCAQAGEIQIGGGPGEPSCEGQALDRAKGAIARAIAADQMLAVSIASAK